LAPTQWHDAAPLVCSGAPSTPGSAGRERRLISPGVSFDGGAVRARRSTLVDLGISDMGDLGGLAFSSLPPAERHLIRRQRSDYRKKQRPDIVSSRTWLMWQGAIRTPDSIQPIFCGGCGRSPAATPRNDPGSGGRTPAGTMSWTMSFRCRGSAAARHLCAKQVIIFSLS